MAITNNAGFPARGSASFPTELGQALATRLQRLMQHFRASAGPRNDRLGGPGFTELVPNLVDETARR